MSAIQTYFAAIRVVHATGQATEHSYRPALRDLFSSLDDKVSVINEPKRVEVGAPDFIFERDGIPVGHCEAKDLDKDLKALKGYSVEQRQRYRKGFANLVYTNGLDFEFYREGELIRSISIGDYLMGVQPRPEEFDVLEAQLRDFVAQRPLTIHSSKKLAEMMAGKAALIKDVMGKALLADLKGEPDSELVGQYEAFKQHLIHDITPADFADLYAETIAYGLFAARLHDDTLDTFSRTEALELLPKSNPFLRSLFGYIAGPDLDDRIAWIIDDLAKIFLACDLNAIMADFGQLTGQNDPFLHFYETFLSAYNPAKRKARGVWYTPEPVVNFIVRAVDEVLRTEFGLPDGLADTSKVKIEFDTGQVRRTSKNKLSKRGDRHIEEKEVHRVQILDPATGTGTFLAEVVKQISAKVKNVAPGYWSQYVEEELIPRVHGFELLMASYAMCHLKLDMILQELGYIPSSSPPRLSVYLTNSLEKGEQVDQSLFAQWLAREAKQANTIKNDMPIMVVIGNPPYSGHSSNKGEWINSLMEVYKQSPELKRPAQAKWLSDDYVKFIRFAEYMIEKNGEGVLGFITNHGYLDNPTFLDMRSHLMETFDRIYVLDLHGNAKKKEVSPDGSADKNVFDIQQGVAIIIAVKRKQTAKEKPLGQVFHRDLWGKRSEKYDALKQQTLQVADFAEVTPDKAPWPFVPRDGELLARYEKGFSLVDLFSPNGRPAPGYATQHDEFAISFDELEMRKKISLLVDADTESEARSIFRLCAQSQWSFARAKDQLSSNDWHELITPTAYRPLDNRVTVFDRNVAVHRRERVTRHVLGRENVTLILSGASEKIGSPKFDAVFSAKLVSELNFYRRGGAYVFPLYLYPEDGLLDQARRVNFDPKIWRKIRELAQGADHDKPDEIAIFDYIYGVLHSPDYRETFVEFLKIGFPRIPWPKTPDAFWTVSEKGAQLRHLHLMEPAAIGDTPYPFEGDGDGVLEKPTFKATKDGLGEVWINKTQRFTSVPEISWSFYIGGYQPAQKWLKGRKGRVLSFADIQHYQRIVKILSETDRIMREIEFPLDVEEE